MCYGGKYLGLLTCLFQSPFPRRCTTLKTLGQLMAWRQQRAPLSRTHIALFGLSRQLERSVPPLVPGLVLVLGQEGCKSSQAMPREPHQAGQGGPGPHGSHSRRASLLCVPQSVQGQSGGQRIHFALQVSPQ